MITFLVNNIKNKCGLYLPLYSLWLNVIIFRINSLSPMPFKIWAIMCRHQFLSFVTLSNVYLFATLPIPYFSDPISQARQVGGAQRHPLFLWPSISPVCLKFFSPIFLNMCPKNSSRFSLILTMSAHLVSIFFRTSYV